MVASVKDMDKECGKKKHGRDDDGAASVEDG